MDRVLAGGQPSGQQLPHFGTRIGDGLVRDILRAALIRLVDARIEQGASVNRACRALEVSPATFMRWKRQLAERGTLIPKKSPGRPPNIDLTPDERRELRRLLVKTNVGQGRGSITLAARLLAESDACGEKLRVEILKPRSKKSTLSRAIRKAAAVDPAVIVHHRSPRESMLQHALDTGTMRINLTTGERWRGGDQQTWDDGSINMVCWVPWPQGGCKTSDRYGCKVSRWQTLLGIDVASGFCPGFSFVMRPRESYRAVDIAAAMARVWMDDVLPLHCILERGSWEAHLSERFYTLAGVQVRHVHTPRQKLVENFWRRLWDRMSVFDGQIGRYRGEMERENKLLTACKGGSLDPRKVFPSLADCLAAIKTSIVFLNSEPMETKTGGSWVPQERYRADLLERPRPALSRDAAWLLAPQQREWTVRRNAIVGGKVETEMGGVPYHFVHDNLWQFIGAPTVTYFDPYILPCRARIMLAQAWHGHKQYTIIADSADCISGAALTDPQLANSLARDGLERAVAHRDRHLRAVRTEYQALGFGGRDKGRYTSIDDGAGAHWTLEMTSSTSRPERHRQSAPARPEEVDALVKHNRARMAQMASTLEF